MLTAFLVACGGGGGSAGTPAVGPGSGASTPSTSSSSVVADTAKIAVSLSSTTVTAGAPVNMTAVVTSSSGAPIPGAVVQFSTNGSLGAFSAPSALTDSNGSASVVLSPAASATAGADTAVATVSYNGTTYTASVGFQLSATNVTISSFTSDTQQLSAYGQANLTVQLAGTSANSPVSLVLTSACAAAGKGTITPATQSTSTGSATFTFRDNGCGAIATSESLQVSITGSAQTKSLSFGVTKPDVASIGFVSASPQQIYLKGTGLAESSNVTFQVKDANGNGLPNQVVSLYLNTTAGGLTLDGSAATVAAPITKQTDVNGNVIVRINSGTVPTPVRVSALLTLPGSAGTVSTVSSGLSVAVGLPTQIAFSLSQLTHNIEGYDIDGIPNTYTIIASDRLANPVPDGTTINFVASSGQISTALLTAGASATAQFKTSSPRPLEGRMTVLAYSLGEPSFIDLHGDNVWHTDDPVQVLGDPMLDFQFNGVYNSAITQQTVNGQSISTGGDQVITGQIGNVTGSCTPGPSLTPNTPTANTRLALDNSIPTTSSNCVTALTDGGALPKVYVRRAAMTVLSRSTASPVWGKNWPNAKIYVLGGSCTAPDRTLIRAVNDSIGGFDSNGIVQTATYHGFGSGAGYTMTIYNQGAASGTLTFSLADTNSYAYNPMPAGTTISATSTTGLSVSNITGTPVNDSLSPTGVSFSYSFDTSTTSGTITFTFTTPKGTSTNIPVNLSISSVVPAGTLCN